jgi:CHAT domain-containing protein
LRFDPLAGTRREAEDVGRLWQTYASAPSARGAPLQVLIGRRASERAFKQQGPGQRILHLATHGFFLGGDCTSALQGTRAVGGLAPSRGTIERGGENPLLLSGLALAGANRRSAARPEEDDGILTAEEVASLNLDGVEWAVLSACDTGLGRVQQGEGVFGLRRAFQVAGARTVIMSLWPVEDQAGRVWMTALYRGRLGQHLDTATAMQQASLTVLRDFRARGRTTHPFFWAGFVAAGDWR